MTETERERLRGYTGDMAYDLEVDIDIMQEWAEEDGIDDYGYPFDNWGRRIINILDPLEWLVEALPDCFLGDESLA